MSFLHFSLLPSLVLIISIILQKWFDKEEFIDFFKIYGLGIATGIIISLVFGIVDGFFKYKVHYFTITLKSIFLNGLLYSAIIVTSFFYINKYFMKLNSSLSWMNATIYSFSFVSGIYTVLNIIQSINHAYPNNPLFYIPMLCMIFFVSILIGLLGPKFLDEFEWIKKIFFASAIILSLSVTFGLFYFLNFYDFIYLYLFIIPFGILGAVFELNEFRYFRR